MKEAVADSIPPTMERYKPLQSKIQSDRLTVSNGEWFGLLPLDLKSRKRLPLNGSDSVCSWEEAGGRISRLILGFLNDICASNHVVSIHGQGFMRIADGPAVELALLVKR
jgi:hypothetical protein